MAAGPRGAGDVGELHRQRFAVQGRGDPVDGPGERVALEPAPAHGLAEGNAAHDLLEDGGQRLDGRLSADVLLDGHPITFDLQRIEMHARLPREAFGCLGPLPVLQRLLRRRAGELPAHVRRLLGDGGDHQREPAGRGVGGDVRALALALAVEAGIVERLVDLRRHPFHGGLLEAGGQLLGADLEHQVH